MIHSGFSKGFHVSYSKYTFCFDNSHATHHAFKRPRTAFPTKPSLLPSVTLSMNATCPSFSGSAGSSFERSLFPSTPPTSPFPSLVASIPFYSSFSPSLSTSPLLSYLSFLSLLLLLLLLLFPFPFPDSPIRPPQACSPSQSIGQ